MSEESVVIAIDGPAASGKSSVSKRLASRLGFLHINSGAMYRAVTWSVVRNGIDPGDEEAVLAHLGEIDVECGVQNGEGTVAIDGVEPGEGLVSESVNKAVSRVASVPKVRSQLVTKQRDYTDLGSLVMEGRDIGSVVFPDTAHKFYIDASEEVRRERRRKQGLTDDPSARDRQDSTRKTSPLTVAEDAVVIDSSDLTIDEVVEEILTILAGRGLAI